MAALSQYNGFGDMGKKLKDAAFTMALSTLILPLSTVGTFIITLLISSRAYYYVGGDYDARTAFVNGCFIAGFCIVGGLYLLFYLANLNYKIRAFKAMKNAGEQSGNPDVSALAKHWFIELVLMVATGPLYAVTGIFLVARYFLPYSIPSTAAPPLLLLGNWFAMVISLMYSVVDGNKKWEPVGQMFTSFKGRTGMQYMRNSQGVGLAICIISHYAMIYLIYIASTVVPCTSGGYPPSYCSAVYPMTGILVPVGIASGILTLVGMVNHIKGLFRVGNTLIDLEEGRSSPSPHDGSSYYRRQVALYGSSPYGAQNAYSSPATGGGYQGGAWNAPRYSRSLQPMQPVEPVRQATPSQASYRDTSVIDAKWTVDGSTSEGTGSISGGKRCTNCQAALPTDEGNIQFCPYCGSKQ
ncbi:MAG: hypothetical protein Q6353_010325 [Candidatus Sigynarchaeum springense]